MIEIRWYIDGKYANSGPDPQSPPAETSSVERHVLLITPAGGVHMGHEAWTPGDGKPRPWGAAMIPFPYGYDPTVDYEFHLPPYQWVIELNDGTPYRTSPAGPFKDDADAATQLYQRQKMFGGYTVKLFKDGVEVELAG